MMDFHAKTAEERERIYGKIGELAYKRYQLAKRIEYDEAEIREIDIGIAEHESAAKELDQVLRNFGTYLAIKEGAVTLEQVAEGIRAGSEPDAAEPTGATAEGE